MIRVLLSLPKHIITEAKDRKQQKEIEKQHKEYEERLIDSRIKVGAYYVKKQQCALRKSTPASPEIRIPKIWEIVDIRKDSDGYEIVDLKDVLGSEWSHHSEYRGDLKENYVNIDSIFDVYGKSLLEDYENYIDELQQHKKRIVKLINKENRKTNLA